MSLARSFLPLPSNADPADEFPFINRNIYYGTIYAYTPEILPSAHRATGYGLCVVLNRVGGILGVLVGSYANVETTAPLFVCAALFGLLVILSLLLPFESKGKRSQ